MDETPRLRMIAGPNGSGKSTLLDFLTREYGFPLGYCFDPDQVERAIYRDGFIRLTDWGIKPDQESLAAFVRAHALSSRVPELSISIRDGALIVPSKFVGSYFVTILGDFFRKQWLASHQSFTFETVMSHPEKLKLVRHAASRGYRTYLYFVCTETPLINRERVANRVLEGGHDVPPDKIDQRYARSLNLLSGAIECSSRAYLFDNSARSHRLIAEYDAGQLVRVSRNLPGWFIRAVLEKRSPPSSRRGS